MKCEALKAELEALRAEKSATPENYPSQVELEDTEKELKEQSIQRMTQAASEPIGEELDLVEEENQAIGQQLSAISHQPSDFGDLAQSNALTPRETEAIADLTQGSSSAMKDNETEAVESAPLAQQTPLEVEEKDLKNVSLETLTIRPLKKLATEHNKKNPCAKIKNVRGLIQKELIRELSKRGYY